MPLSQSFSLTDQGRHRENNEDSYLSYPARGLWAIADGMGGHEAGEVASAIVVETLRKECDKGVPLHEAIADSHRAVLDAVQGGRGVLGMGSTVVALSSNRQHYQVSWVGDSRAYLWTAAADHGELRQLTTDHSYVQMLLDTGAIAPGEDDHHPDKHIITQCLGSPQLETVKVDSVHGEWQKNQWILLCSDGLSDEMSDSEIQEILRTSESPKSACQALLDRALGKGGHDNITLQLICSPLTRDSNDKSAWPASLPRIFHNNWLDGGFYGLLIASLIIILLWATG